MLAELDQIRAAGRKVYDDDPMRQLAAERALQIALQRILDIGNHLIVELDLPLPNKNDEILATLAKADLIPESLATRLKGLGGLRNILVHDYLYVDQTLLFEKHLEQLGDLQEFARAITEYIKKLSPQAERKTTKSKKRKKK